MVRTELAVQCFVQKSRSVLPTLVVYESLQITGKASVYTKKKVSHYYTCLGFLCKLPKTKFRNGNECLYNIFIRQKHDNKNVY